MVETPVLFETFVRVDYARQVWDAIKAAQPKKLYFYSNKGRVEKEGEIERNNEIRSWINEIDWDCELHTWFRDECVNVYDSLRGAITWLFDNEEYGIVLEDDCLPSLAFFSLCDKLMPLYKNDIRVWAISGDNFFERYSPKNCDYFLSRYTFLYGWATWKDRWLKIDWNNLNIDSMIDFGVINQLCPIKGSAKNRIKTLEEAKDFLQRTKCWDYIFDLNCLKHGSCYLIPAKNLVSNIGVLGEHHPMEETSFVNNVEIPQNSDFVKGEYLAPPFIVPCYKYDVIVSRHWSKQANIFIRMFKRAIRLFK